MRPLLDGVGGCTFWPGGMKPGKSLSIPVSDLLLKPGDNFVTFTTGDRENPFPGDVSVLLYRLWEMER